MIRIKQLFLNHSLKLITKYNENYTEEDIEKLQYGLEGVYLTITKLIIITIISLLLGIAKEVLLVLILFNVIRYPGFGFHANNSVTCLLFSAIVFLGLPYLAVHANINIIAQHIICFICLISFAVFAPADTPKRPLTNPKKRKLRKIATVIIAIIYIVCSYIINNPLATKLILVALIIESIMINPITYKLFRQPYNNYKKV